MPVKYHSPCPDCGKIRTKFNTYYRNKTGYLLPICKECYSIRNALNYRIKKYTGDKNKELEPDKKRLRNDRRNENLRLRYKYDEEYRKKCNKDCALYYKVKSRRDREEKAEREAAELERLRLEAYNTPKKIKNRRNYARRKARRLALEAAKNNTPES